MKKNNPKMNRKNRIAQPDVRYIAIRYVEGNKEERFFHSEDKTHMEIVYPKKYLKNVEKTLLALDMGLKHLTKPKDWYAVAIMPETESFDLIKYMNCAYRIIMYSEDLGIPLVIFPAPLHKENREPMMFPNKIAKKFFPNQITMDEFKEQALQKQVP